MAKEMGIDSPLLMFGDEDDDLQKIPRTDRKKSVKRSVRRTTMLPPELSKTLNETFKDRRRSSRLEALEKFENPLEVRLNYEKLLLQGPTRLFINEVFTNGAF